MNCLNVKQARFLGVSYTWVRDMTKRYFGRDGQRITRSAEPEPGEWIPVVERVAAGEMSLRAASDQLSVSVGRVKTMLAHVRGDIIDPTIARKRWMTSFLNQTNAALYRKRSVSIEPVFGNIKANLGFRRFALRGLDWSTQRMAPDLHSAQSAQTPARDTRPDEGGQTRPATPRRSPKIRATASDT